MLIAIDSSTVNLQLFEYNVSPYFVTKKACLFYAGTQRRAYICLFLMFLSESTHYDRQNKCLYLLTEINFYLQ